MEFSGRWLFARHALHDDEVAETIKAVLANARKGGGSDKAGTREALLDFETMFAAYTEERKVWTGFSGR